MMNQFSTALQKIIFGTLRWWNNSSKFFRVSLLVLLALLGLVTGLLVQQGREELTTAKNNVFVFFLIYLNVIFLLTLSFLIGRNVIKLIFDRRRGILGSRLQTRLVVAFAGLALVTNVVLFIFAGGLLSTALESLFSEQVEDAVTGAVDVSKHHYNFLKTEASREVGQLSKRLNSLAAKDLESVALSRRLQDERENQGFYGAAIINGQRKILGEAHNAAAEVELFSEPEYDSNGIKKALQGKLSVFSEEKESSHFIRAYSPLTVDGQKLVLVLTLRIDADLANALGLVNDSFKAYSQLKLYKQPLKAGYLLTLLLITVVILFSAVWFGLYISKQITNPIVELSAATRRVARGDYDTPISTVGDDEMGALARSFNRMLTDLKLSRDDAEKRRLFIETILTKLAVGVISINTEREVTSANKSALDILALRPIEQILGKPLNAILPPIVYETIEPLLKASDETGQEKTQEAELSVAVEGNEKKLVCTTGRLTESGGTWVGTLLLFDDVTELAKAQSMTVWREVARRIAHEIKNPLTPIQLSAQRLQKLLQGSEQNSSVKDCAETIVSNVDLIKRLANEFSNFARMPATELKVADLNETLSSVIALYARSREDILVQFIGDNKLPRMQLDGEQLKRVLMNLIDNAIDALVGSPPKGESPKVVVKTNYVPTKREVTVEISDNGPGIVGAEKIRIFEPYFTTKKGGTGIGLAIVLSIITDHQGTVRVVDNTPRGARFIITLPIEQKLPTQRRLAV